MARSYKVDLCEECGKFKKEVYYRKEFDKKLCKYCNKVYKEHPFLYYPPKGIRAKDNEGRLICHICGRAFENLSSHINTKHNMATDEYKEIYELNNTKSLISENMKAVYRKNNNLKGNKHPGVQFKKGHDSSRFGKRRLEYKNSIKGISFRNKYKKEIGE